MFTCWNVYFEILPEFSEKPPLNSRVKLKRSTEIYRSITIYMYLLLICDIINNMGIQFHWRLIFVVVVIIIFVVLFWCWQSLWATISSSLLLWTDDVSKRLSIRECVWCHLLTSISYICTCLHFSRRLLHFLTHPPTHPPMSTVSSLSSLSISSSLNRHSCQIISVASLLIPLLCFSSSISFSSSYSSSSSSSSCSNSFSFSSSWPLPILFILLLCFYFSSSFSFFSSFQTLHLLLPPPPPTTISASTVLYSIFSHSVSLSHSAIPIYDFFCPSPLLPIIFVFSLLTLPACVLIVSDDGAGAPVLRPSTFSLPTSTTWPQRTASRERLFLLHFRLSSIRYIGIERP